MIYYIETPKDIFWSTRKLDTTYKHVTMLYRDKAKYREAEEKKFNELLEKTSKKVYQLA